MNIQSAIDAAVFDLWRGSASAPVEAAMVLERIRAVLARFQIRAVRMLGRVRSPSGQLDVEVTTGDGVIITRTYNAPTPSSVPQALDNFDETEAVRTVPTAIYG